MLIDKINEIEFNKQEFEEMFNEMKTQIDILNRDESLDLVFEAIDKINEIRDHYLTLYWISYVFYIKDITNEKYLNSEKLMGEIEPIMDNLKLKYFKALNNSKYREELIKMLGSRTLEIAANESKLLNDDIEDLITKEKSLCLKMLKLVVGTKTDFQGHDVTLSNLKPYYQNADESIRKAAYNASYCQGLAIEEEGNNILDELVLVRTELAHKLGFNNYFEVDLIRMNRLGYDLNDMKVLVSQVKNYLVPLHKKLKEVQAQRLGHELRYYDKTYLFPDGNPKIKGNLDFIVKTTSEIINEMNNESGELFDFLFKEGLIDIKKSDHQAVGGITTYLPDYKVPLFVSPCKNIYTDIATIHHEFGHSQQLYYSRNLKYNENRWPTFDICEIHSMSMEFLMFPHAEKYFGNDILKYQLGFWNEKLDYIIRVTMAYEFAEFTYSNPKATNKMRNQKWLELCKAYDRFIEGHEYLEKGIGWQSFGSGWDRPFYNIDYTIDIVCALSFYKKVKENPTQAWEDYISLCKLGGSKSLPELIKIANLDNPFKEGSMKELANVIDNDIEELQKSTI